MNIYEKLQKCRVDLQKSGLKKTGHNKFSDYDYFELGDFLPKTNELFQESKLCGLVSFGAEQSLLTVIDTEKPEDRLEFTCVNAEATLKGCHAIQNIGAVQTYQRRYLYVTALEIAEYDTLDATTGKEETKKDNKPTITGNKPKNDSEIKETPSDLEKRATAIYFAFTGNKEGQYGKTKEQYNEMLKDYKDNGDITTSFGKKWTLQDVEFLENVIAEGELSF